MGLRGPKPKGRIKTIWCGNLAYAVGLLASDGCLSKDGRHIILTSKDKEQLMNFMKALGITVVLGKTTAYDHYGKREAGRVQVSDVLFYRFLLSIGLMPNKSKVIGELKIPNKYFFDFLRGVFDGDGSTYSYFDPRWRSSFMFYTAFVSASPDHISWLRERIADKLNIQGHVTGDGQRTVFQLKYAKTDSFKLLRKMYPHKNVICLKRKRLKIEQALSIVGQRL